MMKNILKTTLLLLCLFLVACNQETDDKQEQKRTVTVTQEIKLRVMPMQSVGDVSTRSDSDKPEEGESVHVSYEPESDTRAIAVDETAFYNGYVLVYEHNLLRMKSSLTAEQFYGKAPLTYTLDMNFGWPYVMYVVVNVPSVLESQLNVGTNLSVLTSTIVPWTVSTTLPQGLPMIASQSISLGGELKTFELKPCLARLKVSCPIGNITLKYVPSGYQFGAVGSPLSVAPVRPSGMTYDAEGVKLTSEATYYVPENIGGQNKYLLKPYTRAYAMTPDRQAMFVEVNSGGTTYDLFPGGDAGVQYFNVVSGRSYAMKVTIAGTNLYDLRVNAVRGGPSDHTRYPANCYAIGYNGILMFDGTVMGNGKSTPAQSVNAPAITPSKLAPVKVDVLWETLNTGSDPTKGCIVPAVHLLDQGRIVIRTTGVHGNAVVAARDAANNILWSWHIWSVDQFWGYELDALTSTSNKFDLTGTYYMAVGQIMDRDLGALGDGQFVGGGKGKSFGLFYQWGRKDPFPGCFSETSSNVAMPTSPGGIPIISKGLRYTIAQSIQQPTTFFAVGNSWHSARNDNLWGTLETSTVAISDGTNTNTYNSNHGSKTIYDPCPYGWRVPPGYAFAKACKVASDGFIHPFSKGYNFAYMAERTIWFPASGVLDNGTGLLTGSGTKGAYWMSALGTYYYAGAQLSFDSSVVNPADVDSGKHAYGCSVRCVSSEEEW